MVSTNYDRNKSIYEERLNGETYTALSEKYGITPSHTTAIFNHMKKQESLKCNPYYPILASLTQNDQLITRAIHVLNRSNLNPRETLLGLTKKDLLKCRNCGKTTAELILQVAEIIRETDG